jgi:hypothetical protein
MATLRAIRNDGAMVSLEEVAKEAAKVAVRELHEGVVARKTKIEPEAQMYIDDTATEESHAVTATMVAAGRTSTWLLVDGNETEVEEDDEDEEAERDAELRAVDAAIREAAAQCNAELVVCE